jgi:hypothetical protein
MAANSSASTVSFISVSGKHAQKRAGDGSRAGEFFEAGEKGKGLTVGGAAHFRLWAKTLANGGTGRVAEQQAKMIRAELDATGESGFAVGHAGNGCGDGGNDAAGTATGPTVHE